MTMAPQIPPKGLSECNIRADASNVSNIAIDIIPIERPTVINELATSSHNRDNDIQAECSKSIQCTLNNKIVQDAELSNIEQSSTHSFERENEADKVSLTYALASACTL